MKPVYDYLTSWYGVPYQWGGNSRKGIDCSGFVQEAMRANGTPITPLRDRTAQEMFDDLQGRSHPNQCLFGSLAFFGEGPQKILHVGFCVDGTHMIEAKGGGPQMVEPDTSGKAFVCLSPIKSRRDLVAILFPFTN